MARAEVLPFSGWAFKIEVSKVSGSALAAEICTGPRNRLLRRQHCSSLCEQSELQCFAPELRRTLLFSKKRKDFLNFEHPP